MEAHFYFQVGLNTRKTLALVSLFSTQDEGIYQYTGGVLTVCDCHGDKSLAVVEVQLISAVVGMVPFGELIEGEDPRYLLGEKLGLDVYDTGIVEGSDDEE